MNEHALVLGATAPLTSIVTEPADGRAPSAAVLLLGAGIVHRVGPGRMYVRLARMLAERGYLTIRFDHSGIGDSDVRRDDLPFEQRTVKETREVMDGLAKERGVDRFVLMGLCSGAETAFRVACEDPRVAGAVMINAQGFDADEQWIQHAHNLNWIRHYRTESAGSAGSWKRLLTGRVNYRRLLRVLSHHLTGRIAGRGRVDEIAERLAGQWRDLVERGVGLLAIYSQRDPGLDYLDLILDRDRDRPTLEAAIRKEVVAHSDHTFTMMRHQQQVADAVDDWIRSVAPA